MNNVVTSGFSEFAENEPTRSGFGVEFVPCAGLAFQNDSLGLVQTSKGPVQWLRCVQLLAGQTIADVAADGIVGGTS